VNPVFGLIHIYWSVLPLVVAISLVYAASRHESWRRIRFHAFRLGALILGLLALTMAVLLAINTQV
jgi:hypothetical protein